MITKFVVEINNEELNECERRKERKEVTEKEKVQRYTTC
jgi:hypothetical protein